MSELGNQPPDALAVAERLAAALTGIHTDYAFGGAIALGYWGAPRGTLDVDVTLFLPPDQPSACARLLQSIGCEFSSDQAIQSLGEHGFCQVQFAGLRVDVFLPTIAFYEQARSRRQQVLLDETHAFVWDAETLCVFKLMFFRRKDLADIEQILRAQGEKLDRNWVREHLVDLYGARDLRISAWDELVSEQS